MGIFLLLKSISEVLICRSVSLVKITFINNFDKMKDMELLHTQMETDMKVIGKMEKCMAKVIN